MAHIMTLPTVCCLWLRGVTTCQADKVLGLEQLISELQVSRDPEPNGAQKMGVEPKIGGFYPQNGWWKQRKSLLKWFKMDDLGGFTMFYPYFWVDTQILMKHEVIYSSDWIRWSDRLVCRCWISRVQRLQQWKIGAGVKWWMVTGDVFGGKWWMVW